ncbi:MAG: hypothetical protein COB54_08520 [Alphaproteobacteria bacterium]|nr:MAG: hypothetical protein COB54_08520 [Alphaproteobacteria bacterium]
MTEFKHQQPIDIVMGQTSCSQQRKAQIREEKPTQAPGLLGRFIRGYIKAITPISKGLHNDWSRKI